MYIGKHHATEYDKTYYGSGKILQLAIKKYGIENFKNEILKIAETNEELNTYEKQFIQEYREKFGNSMLYNIANGGDGGDTLSGKSDIEKIDFINKMTEINRTRCNSEEFKKKLSAATSKRYEDINNRKIQSEKIKASWADESLRKRHSDILKEFYRNHPHYLDGINNCSKKCCFELNDTKIIFDKIEDLKKYLKKEQDYTPCCRTLKKLFEDGKNGIRYKAFHKKFKRLDGMLIYLIKNESVETMDDECNPVGDEIGTSPKCKTEIEEIVHPA